jgi:uncharacterized protein (TIGR00251 family)
VKPEPPQLLQDGADVLLTVHVHPRAARNRLTIESTGRVLLRLTAPPVEGAANLACRAFLADLFDLPKSRVTLVAGETSRLKRLRLGGANAAAILARLRNVD